MSTQFSNIQQFPLYSHNLDDLDTPGVIVEVDPATAEELGAFEETALSEEDAWLSNMEEGEHEND
jgi:hypothetical protein